MTAFRYAFEKYDAEKMARASGRDAAVSTKQAIEICKALRGKSLQDAKQLLEDVLVHKRAIRFTRFTNGIGHRTGKGGAGAYPEKASTAFLNMLNSVETNAQNKGLNTGQLAIVHICAHQASRPMRNGRQRRSEFKRSHLEVVVAETKQKKKEAKKEAPKTEAPKAEVKKEAPKVEAKPEVKKETPKAEKKEAPKTDNPKPAPKAEVKETPKPTPKEKPKTEEKKEEQK